jgi:LmbE family N-acetylglucosaminyl deacetylase
LCSLAPFSLCGSKKPPKNDKPLKVYILSPHIDDAAFGLGLTISKCAENNASVTIINCFTVTKWTGIPVINKDVESVSLLRKNEDAAFYNNIGNINIINLELLDAPLRNSYIFQNQPFQQNELELIEDLKKLLEQHVDGLLFCPLAIGNHIDHTICREALMKLYNKLNVIFFEDLPYAQRMGEDQIRRHIHALEEQSGVQLSNYTVGLNNSIINKEQAIRVYKSQLSDEIVSEIISHLNAVGGERIWGEAQEIESFKSILNS